LDKCSYPTPTNQRAELRAVILALEIAVEKYGDLQSFPTLRLTIYSDSKYVVNCMTNWIYKWRNNGWTNSAGGDVTNRDLVEEAAELEARLERDAAATIEYSWIPREQNEVADRAVNERMDELDG